jgi:putative membrane protein
MIEWLAPWYLTLKALHILAVISWMAGLLYLPRLFVYHAGVAVGSEASETFKVMERRLLKAIMNPASIATWVFGLSIPLTGAVGWTEGWFHGKLLLVVVMTWLHHVLARHVKTFAADQNQHSQRYFRILNEGPTLVMIGIVFLVVLKPF